MGVASVGKMLADLGLFDQMASGATTPVQTHPTIVVLLVDELRFPTVFPDGIKTPAQFLRKYMPNLYDLWQHGVKFTNHHTAGNACSPARATIVTGPFRIRSGCSPPARRKAQRSPPARRKAQRCRLRFPHTASCCENLGYHTPYIGK